MELPLIFVSIFYSVETMRSTEEGIKKIKKRDKKKLLLPQFTMVGLYLLSWNRSDTVVKYKE